MPLLPEGVRAELREAVPTAASGANPVDLWAEADPEAFEKAVCILAKSGAVDSLAVIYTPTVRNRRRRSPCGWQRRTATCLLR